MKIEFDKIKETVIPHFKNGEKSTIAKMQVDDLNKIMYGKLEPGASIGYHEHADGCEVIYILSGTGKALYDDTTETVKAGDCHYCPKGHKHSLINDSAEDLIYFAVVAAQ